MSIDIDDLRRKHAATTQDKWHVKEIHGDRFNAFLVRNPLFMDWPIRQADAIFCAAAHNAFPALLDELEDLRTYRDQAETKPRQGGETIEHMLISGEKAKEELEEYKYTALRGHLTIKKLCELATSLGWNGVANSKILEVFLANHIDEQAKEVEELREYKRVTEEGKKRINCYLNDRLAEQMQKGGAE